MPDTFFYSQLLKLHFHVDASQMAVRNYPVAQALYLKYCRDHNRETLRDIYVQEDDYNAQAACFIRESYDPKVMVHIAELSFPRCQLILKCSVYSVIRKSHIPLSREVDDVRGRQRSCKNSKQLLPQRDLLGVCVLVRNMKVKISQGKI